MTKSVLGPGGYPKAPYGSYASRQTIRLVSVLGPQGVPRPPYGFIQRASPRTGVFTVLGPQGVPRPPYGPFSGRTPVVTGETFTFPFIANVGTLMIR
jgi:hypothetical protein